MSPINRRTITAETAESVLSVLCPSTSSGHPEPVEACVDRRLLTKHRASSFTLIVARGGRLAAIGIICGVIGAAAVTRVVTSLLYSVTATDPLSFAGTAAFLALIALLASYVPARRATAVDPMVALRAE